MSNAETMNTVVKSSLFSFKNSYSFLLANRVTFAFNECPITFSALATSSSLATNSFNSKI